MKENIKNKIEAMKARVVKNSTDVVCTREPRDTSNSLSKSIRNNKEAAIFRAEFKSASVLAKMK